jgi:ABC-type ATPase with predicted acetyltransferase domain
VSVVREENAQGLATRAEIGFDWSKKLIEVLRAKSDQLYELEIVNLEDLPSISLQVGDDRYRPIEKLSAGQKSTVIVLLAMVEGKNPIIFDQVEDALDTAFIYSDVVQSLRKEKERRQFILVTRNPNISVAADADLGIVLEGTADSGQIRSLGGLDRIGSRDLVVLHLEGGPEAFLLRQKKYDLERRATDQ